MGTEGTEQSPNANRKAGKLNTYDKENHLAQQFAVEGHKAYSAIFFFYRKPGGLIPSEGICKAKLKAKIDDKNWETVHEFDFIINAGQNVRIMDSNYCDGRDIST